MSVFACFFLSYFIHGKEAERPSTTLSPAVAIFLAEVARGHAGTGVVTRLARVQTGHVVVTIVSLALQLGLYLTMMMGPRPVSKTMGRIRASESLQTAV